MILLKIFLTTVYKKISGVILSSPLRKHSLQVGLKKKHTTFLKVASIGANETIQL